MEIILSSSISLEYRVFNVRHGEGRAPRYLQGRPMDNFGDIHGGHDDVVVSV
jgi:hypothetical protein